MAHPTVLMQKPLNLVLQCHILTAPAQDVGSAFLFISDFESVEKNRFFEVGTLRHRVNPSWQ
jgi:hypothetical protein